jgi:hypothetical protein
MWVAAAAQQPTAVLAPAASKPAYPSVRLQQQQQQLAQLAQLHQQQKTCCILSIICCIMSIISNGTLAQ